MNVIANSKQDVYVPWLICMDSGGDNLSACDSQVGISTPASTAPKDVLNKFFNADKSIGQTPTVHVNGQNVKTSYSAIREALCSADPSLKGCSSEVPNAANEEIKDFCVKSVVPPANVVV